MNVIRSLAALPPNQNHSRLIDTNFTGHLCQLLPVDHCASIQLGFDMISWLIHKIMSRKRSAAS
jgi:hypothetical protein